jgi:hypothetical protein
MKETSKYGAKIATFGVLATVLMASVATVSADNNNKLSGWVKAGSEVRYVDSNDANTNVDINKNGVVSIRGGKVVAISGNQIVVSSTLGSSVLTWTGSIDSTTKLEAKNGKTIELANIAVGDVVTVKGTMNSGSGLSFKTSLIRDISKAYVPVVANTKQIFEGKLTALPGSTTPTSITMMIGNTAQVVSISPTTLILNSSWLPVGLSTFQLNDQVRVFGFVPSGSNVVTGLVLRNATR